VNRISPEGLYRVYRVYRIRLQSYKSVKPKEVVTALQRPPSDVNKTLRQLNQIVHAALDRAYVDEYRTSTKTTILCGAVGVLGSDGG
jgi:hypothetical protein